MPKPSIITLVADGIRPDTLAAAVREGAVPALAQLVADGTMETLTTVFPSVTGPAYVPFLMGAHPGAVGMPGLRWYDRARSRCTWPGYARSYVGIEMRHVNHDLDPTAPTLFELAASHQAGTSASGNRPSSIGALSVITRGLPSRQQIGAGLRFAASTAWTHFRGDVRGWLAIDRAVGETLVRKIRDERPAYVFAAFTGVDKTSHAAGHHAPIVREALQIVNDVVAAIRTDAERGGYWHSTHLWIVSDHGHSPVRQHDDLAGNLARLGSRVLAHPWITTWNPEIAVMVSGNAMAHVYVDLASRTRPFGDAVHAHWPHVLEYLQQRDSVDLLILPRSPTSCDIHTRDRGMATLTWTTPHAPSSFRYTPVTGDPLGIGEQTADTADHAYHVTQESDYPDALVQIATLVAAPRSGDIILSARRDWDFRATYEPIPHVSSHGALHREHMRVPFITNRTPAQTLRRTTDLFTLARTLLGSPNPR